MMKAITVAFCLLAVGQMGRAQGAGQQLATMKKQVNSSPQASIAIHFSHVSLKNALDMIAEKMGVGVSYKTNILPSKVVSYQATEASVWEVLKEVLKGTGLYATASPDRKTILVKRQINNITNRLNNVSGTVTDAQSGDALPGVNIQVKGKTIGTTADSAGYYSLQVPSPSDTLVYSYIGYQQKVVPVSGRSKINVALKQSVISGQQMVVIGYGKEKQEDVTSSISSVKTATIAQKPVVNATNNLAGRVAGVLASQRSGEPGFNGSSIHIRGISTIGDSSPLVIVDGVQRDFSNINPNNIKSISILKDAAAVAPYGIAGANGVILVTTKQGSKGKPQFSYDGYIGFQNPTFVPRMVNSYQFAKLKNLAQKNVGGQPAYSDEELQGFKSSVNGEINPAYPNSDALREIIRKNAPISRNSLNVSGGTDDVTYYASLGYTSQGGMWTTTNTKRYNADIRLDADVTKTTHAVLHFSGYDEQGHYPTVGAGSVFYQAFRTPAVSAVYYPNGKWGAWDGKSLVGYIHHSGYQTNKNRQVYSSISIKQDLPLPGLSIRGKVSYDPYDSFQKTWSTPIPNYRYDANTQTYSKGLLRFAKPRLAQSYDRSNAFTFQGYLNYDNSFGKNNISLTGVFESHKSLDQNFNASKKNYNLDIAELDDGSSVPADLGNGGTSSQSRRLGLVFRGSYNYANTYLVSVSGRYDGHYYFAPGHRYELFPAVSVGWNIAKEKFMQNIAPWITSLKLRGSWGKSGNLAGSPFQYLSTYGIYGNATNFNGAPTQGIYEQSPSNESITWETAVKKDVGIDISLWHDEVTATVDYFHQKRSDMLITPNVTVPVSYGIGLNQVNAGIMSNHGLEFSVGYNHTFSSGIKLNLNGNFTWAHNKLIQTFESPATKDNPRRRRTGRAFNTQFGYKDLGLFTKADFNADGSLKQNIATQPWGQVNPGDIRYADLNGDGKITADDQTVIGRPRDPEINFGFEPRISYKNLSLDILFQGAAQTDLYLNGWIAHPFNANGNVTLLQYKDHWSADNPDPHARYPRIHPAQTENNSQGSSYWMRNATYFRIKSAQLSYTLPSVVANALTIRSLQVYVAGQNLYTWTPFIKYHLDPEAGAGNGQYYFQQQVFSVGAHIKF